MPHNNPEHDVDQGGGTVYIDASALGELSSQLTQHELEALVGLNIQASDLEALQEATEAHHVVDQSGHLISEGVTVGNIVEVGGDVGGHHVSLDEATNAGAHVDHHIQSMEVDTLEDHTQVISDMDMLNQGGELLHMTTGERLGGDGTLLTSTTMADGTATHQIVTDSPQILKSNLGQFVVLQGNQGLTLSSVGNRIMTSSGQVVTSLAGGWGGGGGSNKPLMVSAQQLTGGGLSGNFRQQLFLQTTPSTSQQQHQQQQQQQQHHQQQHQQQQQVQVQVQQQQQQPQIRTVHMKQIPQQQQINNSGNVTKVIISSQAAAGNGGGTNTFTGGQPQQIRFLNTLQQGSTSHQTNLSTPVTASPTKLTLQQAQQMGLISPSKTITHSPNKIVVQRVSMSGASPAKSPSKMMIPVSMALKSPTKIAPAPAPQSHQQILSHQISSGGSLRGGSIMSSPQKIVIKSNIPQPGQGTLSTVRSGQILSAGGQQVIKIPASQVSQLTGHGQNVQVLANKMNYIRLVNPGSGGGGGGMVSLSGGLGAGGTTTTTTTLVRPLSSNIKPIAPASQQPIKIKAMPAAPNFQNMSKQRVIIPVTSSGTISGVPIRPQQTTMSIPASALPPGMLSNTQPGSVVMIPAQYMSQLQSGITNSSGIGAIHTTTASIQLSAQANLNSLQQAPAPQQPPKPPPPRTIIDANGIRPRKPCNCTKSQCLKLYCDCFANGEFCNNCNCANCFNNLSHEEERQKAIKACLDRNPNAFRPKIGKGGNDAERRHNKGCNCKRSGCLKNYCECYEAKIPCSNMCKCVGCKNVDTSPGTDRKGLMQLAECAEARVNQQNTGKSKLPSFSHLSPAKMGLPQSAKSGVCRMTQEVVEATCQCLLAQADKAESAGESQEQQELTVIKEFSRCLMQIIGNVTQRNRGLSDT